MLWCCRCKKTLLFKDKMHQNRPNSERFLTCRAARLRFQYLFHLIKCMRCVRWSSGSPLTFLFHSWRLVESWGKRKCSKLPVLELPLQVQWRLSCPHDVKQQRYITVCPPYLSSPFIDQEHPFYSFIIFFFYSCQRLASTKYLTL